MEHIISRLVQEYERGTITRRQLIQTLAVARNAASRPSAKIGVDHIAYTLANWDTDKRVKPAVEAELKRRGLIIRATGNSFHVHDPDGFEVQMGGKEQ